MSCLFRLPLRSASSILSGVTTRFPPCSSLPRRRRSTDHSPAFTPLTFESLFSGTRFRCYSSSSSPSSSSSSSSKRRKSKKSSSSSDPQPPPPPDMGEEKHPFFVVRKGDLIGVYSTLTECQAQVGASIFDTPASVYKGSSLPKDTQEYLSSRGLQNALYTIKASDLKEDIFGALVPCSFPVPAASKGDLSGRDLSVKRAYEELASQDVGSGSLVSSTTPSKHMKLDPDRQSCVIEFDGASKGNPGHAGAGVVLRASDGSLICKLRQGLGTATNNAAEYRAIILGLKYALEKGYTSICAKGDSKLVCMQLQGLWKVKHQNMSDLYGEAKKLVDKFLSFQISHVLREYNSEADAQANLAVNLADGQVQVDFL